MLPRVLILGRPNVGKSSLLNLLAGKLISIVDPTPGVTRDRISTHVDLPGEGKADPVVSIELIDTGGYGIAPPEDPMGLRNQIEGQIARGLAEADLVLLVVDAQSGIVALDEQVAHWLREASGNSAVPVLVVANKVDSPRYEAGAYEAARLGFGEPVMVSATSGYGKAELVEAIRWRVEKRRKAARAAAGKTASAAADRPGLGMLLAIVGKRNAGKSTLVNALAGQERMIVSELEGTTRDAVDVRFEMGGKVFTAIDTAGVRKTKSLKGDIEYYSQHRALRSVRRADVVLLLLDATLPVSHVDQQLAEEIAAHYKPAIVVINKWDLAEEKTTQDQYMEYLAKELAGLNYAPVAFVSAKAGRGMKELVATALGLYEQGGTRVPTAQLNEVFAQMIAERPPTSGIGRRPKVYYVSQLEVHPPTIVLFVNDPSMFTAMYQRYLLNRLRERLPFAEVPIKLEIRGRKKAAPAGAQGEVAAKPKRPARRMEAGPAKHGRRRAAPRGPRRGRGRA